MNFKERIINAIYGQCVADAVGNFFEFKTNINPNDVIEYANTNDQLVISDDSQMAIFGFEAVKNLEDFDGSIEQKVRDSFATSYLDWFDTQSVGPSPHEFYEDCLMSFRSMYSIQAPGDTCLSALKSLSEGDVVKNTSMGCGGVMRLLPVVTFFENYPLSAAIRFGQITGHITHKHPKNDAAIKKYIEAAYATINDRKVIEILADKISDLGDGWIAPECVDMAIWAYRKAETFDDLIKTTCSIQGDSDSVAAVAGSLWGLSGREVPQKYINKLDALDAIAWTVENIKK